jgi:glycerophosphoryl diester phosphodiesterase
MPTTIIAHRGASADAPENTIPAFELALQQGAHMLEFDIRPTADGQIVVFHDDTTARWNGEPSRIDALTLPQVQALDIGGARVPTLAEVLDWARTTDLRLNVEIKVPGIERAVARLIHDHDLVERVIVSSFYPSCLQTMRYIAPEMPLGVLMGINTVAPRVRVREALPLRALRQVHARAWHPAWQLPMLHRIIRRVRAAGYAVNVWTVDDPAIMRRLLALDVEGIITNRPALLRDVIRAWRAEQS